MKQVKRRTLLVLLPVLLLVAGVAVFCGEYIAGGARWAAFAANETTHTDGRLSVGRILDRNGVVLYDAETGSYAEDWITRIATLHAVGDPHGNIGTAARVIFADRMVGFDPVFGAGGRGGKVCLTIDSALNETAYGLLAGQKGTAAIYNYRTGEVLCMVSAPAFDPAWPPEIRDGDSQYEGVYLNRFLSASFTPGSVFKIVTTAAALETLRGVQDSRFTCEGHLAIGDGVVTCPEAHGELDLREALACSCNCFYAQLALELGGETLQRYAEKAGLLSGVDVSGVTTAAGSFTVGTDEDLGWSGVGQYEDLVNPCALMTLMGGIAREGAPVLPRLLHRETSFWGLPRIVPGRAFGSAAFSPETCRLLKEMMSNNVTATYGAEKFGGLSLCAKSGTAEVGAHTAPHAWFAGFLDDDSHPLAFVVLVENGGSGAAVAGRIASQLLQEAVATMDNT